MPQRKKVQAQHRHQRAPIPPSPPSPQHGLEYDKEKEGSPLQLPLKQKLSKKIPSPTCAQRARSLQFFSSSSNDSSNSFNMKYPPAG
eukprot:8634214-Ditylum_brightwellii.AAC.1